MMHDSTISVLVFLAYTLGWWINDFTRPRTTPKEAAEILAGESARVRDILKPQRRFIPYEESRTRMSGAEHAAKAFREGRFRG